MNHKQALEAVIAAWDAPDYGDTDTRLDNVFDAVEAARAAADDFYALWFVNFHSEREFVGAFSSRALAESYASRFSDAIAEIEPLPID